MEKQNNILIEALKSLPSKAFNFVEKNIIKDNIHSIAEEISAFTLDDLVSNVAILTSYSTPNYHNNTINLEYILK